MYKIEKSYHNIEKSSWRKDKLCLLMFGNEEIFCANYQ